MSANVCSIVGCNKPARSPRSELCEMHYYRKRRGTPAMDSREHPDRPLPGEIRVKKKPRPYVRRPRDLEKNRSRCRQYHAIHGPEMAERKRALRAKFRELVLEHYGRRCSCCGETRNEFLCVDHVNGGGIRHRKDNNIHGGEGMYRWLLKNDFPDGFRILCHNCNLARGIYGYCPHEMERPSG